MYSIINRIKLCSDIPIKCRAKQAANAIVLNDVSKVNVKQANDLLVASAQRSAVVAPRKAAHQAEVVVYHNMLQFNIN